MENGRPYSSRFPWQAVSLITKWFSGRVCQEEAIQMPVMPFWLDQVEGCFASVSSQNSCLQQQPLEGLSWSALIHVSHFEKVWVFPFSLFSRELCINRPLEALLETWLGFWYANWLSDLGQGWKTNQTIYPVPLSQSFPIAWIAGYIV